MIGCGSVILFHGSNIEAREPNLHLQNLKGQYTFSPKALSRHRCTEVIAR